MAARRWFERAAGRSESSADGIGDGRVGGAPGVGHLTVDREQWCQVAADMAAGACRLLSLWASHGPRVVVHAAFAGEAGVLLVSLPLPGPRQDYPGIGRWFPSAARLQRALADLSGLSSGDADTRGWLRHAAWPPQYFPLADVAAAKDSATPSTATEDYAFLAVEGEGVHEIAVGPVHAGIIEPGHFRFSVVGEKVLRLEERLGYVHKGIEQRFAQLPLRDAHRLAARVSGDSAVAYSWAYCQALEGMLGAAVPARAGVLRALALELERLANHLGDLGAIANDGGFAFGLAQFSRLKEHLLRATEAALGQRYLLDFIVPGGTRVDLSAAAARALLAAVQGIVSEVDTLRSIYDDHAGLRDRFAGTGVVTPALAVKLGLTGLAGRASGQAFDLRCDLPCEPYVDLPPRKIVLQAGDVAARVAVRFAEVTESAGLLQHWLQRLPDGAHQRALDTPAEGAFGVGLIEGWRGPVFLALEAGAEGRIRRCHPHDPSWQNWPVIEHAVIDNIVPDFPLINKSFNLSYSGHDL